MLNLFQHLGMDKPAYIYILTNKNNTTLYTGVTSNLKKRIWEHKNNFVEGFSKKYKLHKLIYFEIFDVIEEAIKREKQIKNWHRNWKMNLIKSENPKFEDLYEKIIK